MEENSDKKSSNQHHPQFGQIAVDMGFVTNEQLKEAIDEQIADDVVNKPRRLIREIFSDKGWMTHQQILIVTTVLNKRLKKQE